MRILYIAALITITSLCMQEELQPNRYLISCCDGTMDLTPKQWNLLFNHSTLLQHAAQFNDDERIIYLPNITITSLADIIELLDNEGIYPIDDINRINVLLQGASFLDLTSNKIAPLIDHLKHLITSFDVQNEQTKNPLQPCKEQQPNRYLIACRNGTQELTTKQWDLLFHHSKLLQHATELHGEQHTIDLPDIATSSLADIVELLNDQGTYPIDNINRIDALLQSASYLDLTPKKIAPLIVHLKHLISPLDIRNEQTKNILQSCYAWQYRKILYNPIFCTSCLNTLTGHTQPIRAVVFCNNNILASGSDDWTIKLWNIKTGECLKTLEEHTDKVNTLAFCKRNILASGSKDTSIKLWNIKTGKCFKTLKDHTASINVLAHCGDNIIASGSGDTTIKLWNIKTGEYIKTLEDHVGPITALAHCGDNILASGAGGFYDTTVKLWNIKTGKCFKTLSDHPCGITSLAKLKHNILFSRAFNYKTTMWDLNSGQCLRSFDGHLQLNNVVALCKDNMFVSGWIFNGNITLWDLRFKKPRTYLFGHTDKVNILVLSKNNILASGSTDTTIKLWDLSAFDPKSYTPVQNALMHTLLENKEDVEILASILQDNEWQSVYKALPDTIRHTLEESVPLIQSKNLID